MIDLTQNMPKIRYYNKRKDYMETEDSDSRPLRSRRSPYAISLKAFSIPGITDQTLPDQTPKNSRQPRHSTSRQGDSEMVDEAVIGRARRSVSRSVSVGSRKGSVSVCSRKGSVSVCSRKGSV